MLLGEAGASVEGENFSTMSIRVAQWGQWKPVMEAAVGLAAGDRTGLG